MKDFSRRSVFGLLGAGLAAAALGTSAAHAEQVVVYERTMPPPRAEWVPPPRAGWFWVPGHWKWAPGRGRWVWVRGHHVRRGRPMPPPVAEVVPVRPSPRMFWVRGHWEWADRRGDWAWVPGRWAR